MRMFETFMQAQMFEWDRTNLKTGKVEKTRVQGALRPIELWEYVFPEPQLDNVLTMLNIPETPSTASFGVGNLKIAALRKMLGNGVQPIPKFKKTKTHHFVDPRGIAIYPIGIKKDVMHDWKEIGYRQEML